MATLFVDKVDPQSGTSLEIGSSGDTITSSATMGSGMGKLDYNWYLPQILQKELTTSTSFVTGSNTLSVNITPASTSNKVFVCVSLGSGNNTSGHHTYTTIYRD